MVDIYALGKRISTKLLTDFNMGAIELIRMVPGNGPAHNPGPATPTPVALKAVARPVKGSVLLQADSLIKEGDLQVTAAIIDGIKPSTSDKIKIDGQIYTIIKINVLPPAGVASAWAFFVRR